MNELLMRYQLAGELADATFALIHAGNYSHELIEQLEITYHMLVKERAVIYDKVRDRNEGV